MKTGKPTSGEWEFYKQYNDSYVIGSKDTDDTYQVIAWLGYSSSMDIGENLANAKLISKAYLIPELVAALAEITEKDCERHCVWDAPDHCYASCENLRYKQLIAKVKEENETLR